MLASEPLPELPTTGGPSPLLLVFVGHFQVLSVKYVITRSLLPAKTRWTFSILIYRGVGGATDEREGEMVPASGVRVCVCIDIECLVPPICFLLSQGATEELQLHWDPEQQPHSCL